MAKHSRSTIKIVENSLFLMSSTGLTAGIGFLFWIAVDRNYSPQRVGLATSLINAISLISYMSLFGLNSLLIRHQAKGPARSSQITRGLLISSVSGLAFGGGFLALLPWLAPKLEFVRSNPLYALLFVGFCSLAAVNLLTDSVFIAARLPQYNMLVDGLIQSLSKLAMPLLLVTFGAIGIVASTGIGYAVAVVASLVFMYRRLGYRVDLRTPGSGLRENARYTLANYGSSLLDLVPQLALPMIALQRLGSEAEAYYFMAFQIANILYTASHSIGDATFSEASHDVSRLAECLRRSAKLNVVILAPAAVVVSLAAGLVLDLFGQTYAVHARSLLVLLAAGAMAVAFNNWSSNALRVAGAARPMVASNAVYAVVSIGMAQALAGRGLLWIGWAWVAGNLLSGAVAAACVPSSMASLAPESGPAAEDSQKRPAPAAEIDETMPLALPWVVRDVHRGGGRLSVQERPTEPVRRMTESIPRPAEPFTRETDPVADFGGDMAVRERVPEPARQNDSHAW